MQWEVLEAKIGNWIHFMRIAVSCDWSSETWCMDNTFTSKCTMVLIRMQLSNHAEQVKLLFAGERKVCDQMFEGIDSLRDQCFAEVTASSVAVLLSFGDAIAKSKRSPEKLFVLLDMYEIMRELHSEVRAICKNKHLSTNCLHFRSWKKKNSVFSLKLIYCLVNRRVKRLSRNDKIRSGRILDKFTRVINIMWIHVQGTCRGVGFS